MTILAGLRSLENPLRPLTDASLAEALGGSPNASGVSVNENTALNMSAVWRAVNLIAGVSAAMPLKTYKRNTRDRVVVRLLDNPHPDMTPFELWRLVYTHVALWGNAYLRKVRNSAGVVVWLDPIHPSLVKVGRVQADDDTPSGKVFEITMPNGRKEPATSYEIMHIPGFSVDGLVGVSPISMARTSIGLGLAAEQYGAKLFGSGSLMSGILQTDQVIDDATATQLKNRWRSQVGGLGNSHEIAVLGAGASFQPIVMPNNDAQFIESRRFQVAEIGRWYGLPGHFLGDTEKSTTWGSGIEHMSIGMVVYTLQPTWLKPVEQRITREATPPGTFAEYAVEGLLRGDSAARAEFYRVMREVGAYSANDIRARENETPVEGGDTYLQPLNMAPLGSDPNASDDSDSSEA